MEDTILYIVLGIFALFIIAIGLAYKKGYIPKTEKWGLKKIEELKKESYSGYTKLGDTPDSNSFCCLTENSEEELRTFCDKYKIPSENNTERCDRFNTLTDSYKMKHGLKEDAHLVYNNNVFKLFKISEGKSIIKNLSILNGFKKKLKELEGIIDKLELEVTFRMLDIQLSNDTEYTYISKPIINQ